MKYQSLALGKCISAAPRIAQHLPIDAQLSGRRRCEAVTNLNRAEDLAPRATAPVSRVAIAESQRMAGEERKNDESIV